MKIINETIIECGEVVLCDFCNDNFTTSDEMGGFYMEGGACCPHCEKEMLESIKKYGEEKTIKKKPKKGETFRSFVLRLRGGDNTIKIYNFSN